MFFSSYAFMSSSHFFMYLWWWMLCWWNNIKIIWMCNQKLKYTIVRLMHMLLNGTGFWKAINIYINIQMNLAFRHFYVHKYKISDSVDINLYFLMSTNKPQSTKKDKPQIDGFYQLNRKRLFIYQINLYKLNSNFLLTTWKGFLVVVE